MEEDDDVEILSSSYEPSDSSDEFTAEPEEDEEDLDFKSGSDDEADNISRSTVSSAPHNKDRKSQNVDALVRYYI